jgi:hypothetical protein
MMSRAINRAVPETWKWWMCPFLLICSLLSISQAATARGTDFNRSSGNARAQNPPGAIPDSQFAIGDFDGDRRPDLTTVEIARFNSLHSRYSISFQLSTGRPQTIGVTAPAGGLALFAQDVNGDRALDVVLVTAWRHELVAVLLNDGKGNFSTADPRQFEISAVSSKAQIERVPRLPEDRTVLSFQYSALREPGRKIAAGRESEAAFSGALDFAVALFPSSLSSRAPPRSSFHA